MKKIVILVFFFGLSLLFANLSAAENKNTEIIKKLAPDYYDYCLTLGLDPARCLQISVSDMLAICSYFTEVKARLASQETSLHKQGGVITVKRRPEQQKEKEIIAAIIDYLTVYKIQNLYLKNCVDDFFAKKHMAINELIVMGVELKGVK